jgi:preprotein translocase subunit SecA
MRSGWVVSHSFSFGLVKVGINLPQRRATKAETVYRRHHLYGTNNGGFDHRQDNMIYELGDRQRGLNSCHRRRGFRSDSSRRAPLIISGQAEDQTQSATWRSRQHSFPTSPAKRARLIRAPGGRGFKAGDFTVDEKAHIGSHDRAAMKAEACWPRLACCRKPRLTLRSSHNIAPMHHSSNLPKAHHLITETSTT